MLSLPFNCLKLSSVRRFAGLSQRCAAVSTAERCSLAQIATVMPCPSPSSYMNHLIMLGTGRQVKRKHENLARGALVTLLLSGCTGLGDGSDSAHSYHTCARHRAMARSVLRFVLKHLFQQVPHLACVMPSPPVAPEGRRKALHKILRCPTPRLNPEWFRSDSVLKHTNSQKENKMMGFSTDFFPFSQLKTRSDPSPFFST